MQRSSSYSGGVNPYESSEFSSIHHLINGSKKSMQDNDIAMMNVSNINHGQIRSNSISIM